MFISLKVRCTEKEGHKEIIHVLSLSKMDTVVSTEPV